MFMPKKPLSVTLEADNLLWLRGRVASGKRRSLSEALDEVVTAARQAGGTPGDIRSVVGTIDLAPDDPALERADTHVDDLFSSSLARPVLAREEPGVSASAGARPAVGRAPARAPRRG
jgi:hypothetical protein